MSTTAGTLTDVGPTYVTYPNDYKPLPRKSAHPRVSRSRKKRPPKIYGRNKR